MAESSTTTMEAGARSRKAFESRRQREFYSYYQSILSRNDGALPLCDLNNPESVASHRPVSSPDKALTAYAQLAACRLHARRAMVFLFDAEYAWILAEATRTLSLQDDSHYEENDSLWLGSTRIPRGFSVCEVTATLPSNEGSNRDDAETSAIAHIVNNLKNDTRFCDRAYVNSGPMARFYAGAPITTQKGINIGAFCVLDESPREGLTADETRFLCEMAQCVMTHLEAVRAKAENEQSTRMINALGAFVEGKTRSQDWWLRDASRLSRPGLRPVRVEPRPPQTPPQLGERRLSFAMPIVETLLVDGGHAPTPQVRTHGNREKREDCTVVMDRAAQLILESLKVDGVVFLEATTRALGGQVKSSHVLTETPDDSHSSEEGSSHRPPHPTRRHPRSCEANHCSVLGSARTTTFDLVEPDNAPVHVGNKLLRRLLRRYPDGHVWHFGAPDAASSEDSSTELSLTERNAQKRQVRTRDSQRLRRLFPRARSLLLVGLWDTHQEDWYAGSFVWSCSATRVLSAEGELSYLAAFGDVVLAELSRLKAQIADQAKNDFISSISHELRSPLHGILGSASLLEDRGLDALGNELVRSIASCGTTLSDIVEHLLEYSRIARQTQHQRLHDNVDHALQKASLEDWARSSMPADQVVLLDIQVEDAVNAACIGYEHRQCVIDTETSTNTVPDRDVLVILDIEKSYNGSWGYYVSAGAFQRICVNLVSNALKYTKAGSISISLRNGVEQHKGAEQTCDRIILTVVDTGIGMSEEYQRHSLFRPFRQENSLAEGTGLGLNLVAKIVKSYGGTVTVESQQDIGTSVTVSLPLAPPLAASQPQVGRDGTFTPTDFEGIFVRFIGFLNSKQDLATQNPGLLRSLRRGCEQLGLRIATTKSLDTDHADLNFVFGDALFSLDTDKSPVDGYFKGVEGSSKPSIVVCKSRAAALKLGSMPIRPSLAFVQFIWLPIGPAKLAAAVGAALHPTQRDPTERDRALSGLGSVVDPRPPKDDGQSPCLPLKHPRPTQQHPRPEQSLPTGQPHASGQEDRASRISRDEPSLEQTLPPTRPPLDRFSSLPVGSSTKPKRLSLLLVDDNHVNLRLLTLFASKSCYPFLTARNGLEAVDLYKRAAEPPPAHLRSEKDAPPRSPSLVAKPDVILMDINMPDVDGFEAARRIREHEYAHGISAATIVALTGLGNAEARDRAQASGMDLFLTKPVRLRDLKALLEEMEARQK